MSQPLREQLKVVSERAVLVHVHLPGRWIEEADPLRELRALAESAGAAVVGELQQNRGSPDPRTYLGKGKVGELADLIGSTRATLAIFDNDLSPSQIRALEEDLNPEKQPALAIKIIDRSELILDIFARRATTRAARLQVEIAQVEYTYPRLRAMWSHLERVAGGAPVGIGTRGPGEQQLEIDRRLAKSRLRQLRHELAGIEKRTAMEVDRRNAEHFTVGLVGYTNAGKSTLFNRLTAGGAFAHDQLFATLSTRVERWDVGGGESVMLSDTVGFIRDLPHHLVASFRSTLEEAIDAQLLLLVVDAADRTAEMQLDIVRRTLDEIGAAGQPRLLVLNKVDRLERRTDLLVLLNRWPEAIAVSAVTGEGLAELAEAVRDRAIGPVREVEIELPSSDGRAVNFIERRTEILSRAWDDGRARYRCRIGARQFDRLAALSTELRTDGEPSASARRRFDVPSDPGVPRIPPHHRLHAT
ncbi:MAG: GTPase HflX [Phycisphaeraceae bacterium]|nr:GTPase HflX [Phycisphaeraceae bacterium]